MNAKPNPRSAQSKSFRQAGSSRLRHWLRSLPAAALALCMAAAPAVTSAETLVAADPVAATAKKPLIQVAVLLDTSNSMDGLINQARASLWRIVSELARARRHGQIPELQVALYEYGNDRLPKSEGHIRQVVPLTTDLDRISEELFALTTNGGSEHCGQAIDRAINGLQWATGNDSLKLIFIAGNEPFSQGPVDYRKAVKNAIAKGVAVNTIFCGSESEGISTGWREGAQLADGQFSFIDSNRQVAQVAAPQDAELERLGEELNRTYIAYGKKGKAKKERMQKQDANAASLGSSTKSTRVAAKATAQYRNTDWDLVDAAEAGAAAPAELAEEELPDEMKSMSKKERKEYVAKTADKRKELQAKISTLSKERKAYVARQQKDSAATGAANFDDAVLESIQGQASKAGFELAK